MNTGSSTTVTDLAEFKAALVPLTAAEVTKIQAEFDAIDAKAKAAKDAFTLGGGYAVSTVDGVDLDALEAIYAEEKAYEVYNKAYEEGAIEKYGYDTDCKVTMVEKIQ